jgi:hypothetical protein
MNRQASLRKIIANDYTALVSFLFPLVTWGLYGLLKIMGDYRVDNNILPVIFIILTVIFVICLVWRVTLIKGVIAEGLETPTISSVQLTQARSLLPYTYVFQGQNYTGRNALVNNKKVEATYKTGTSVVLLVDPGNPKRAFIRDLYSRDE